VIELEYMLDGRLHSVTLEDGETRVGRAADSGLQIPEPGVSKHHAMLRVDGEDLFVRDLGSTNGTHVDGSAVGKDEVEVGSHATIRFASVSLWRATGQTANPGLSLTVGGGRDFDASFTYLGGQEIATDAGVRIVEVLSELFELLASNSDREEIQSSACEFVARCVDADRVVLLRDTGRENDLQILAKWVRGQQQSMHDLRLSTTIVGRVMQKRETVLVGNALDDPDFQGKSSIVALDLSTAMAAPLFDNQHVHGILYVDCSRPRVRYQMEDLQVLTAVANAVAIKLRALSLEKEIRTAARIQRLMLPASVQVPEGWSFDAHLVMSKQVGGDLYHCLPRPNGHLLLAVGDVAGKGVPASLAMAATIVLLRSLNEMDTELAVMGPHLDQQLLDSLAAEQFVTLFLGDLDPENGELYFINAGHEPPLLRRGATGEIETLASTGRPVALLPGGEFGVAREVLEPGDLLVVFSDGIPEATVNGDEFLGLDAVLETLRENGEQPLDALRKEILGHVDAYLGDEPASDDVTLLMIRREKS
jgi:serine phosphatase RsbU (regulator of sigma subunit)